MGGDYYDREMSSHHSNIGEIPSENVNNIILPGDKVFSGEGSRINQNCNLFENYYSIRNKVGRQNGLHPTLDPRNYKEKNMKCKAKYPVVFALDVTGSMCEWPQIIYDKMPMFYGQIMQNKYLNDLEISFCAVADYGDEITLQVTEFSQAHQIDERISLLYLGGGMGPLIRHEAYEASGFFYSYMCDLENAELPFFFLTCDEDFYPSVEKYRIKKKFGRDIEYEEIKAKKIFQDLQKKFNVFIIKKPYDSQIQAGELDQWINVFGKERILVIDNPKASIDVILGAIAVTNGKTLEEYFTDMQKRGQTEERIAQVGFSLNNYYEALKAGKIKVLRFEPKARNEKISSSSEQFKSGIASTDKHYALDTLENELNLFYSKFTGCDFGNDTYLNELSSKYGKVDIEFNGKIPEEYLCPLTKKLFIQPVKLNDGSVFERQAIDKWLEISDLNPFTKEKINKNYTSDYKSIYEVSDYYESVKNLLDF